MSLLGDTLICRDYMEEVEVRCRAEDARRALFTDRAPSMEFVTERRYWRKIKLACGSCSWQGWSEPWRISSLEAPMPRQGECDDKIPEACPRCGTAKNKEQPRDGE